MLYNPYIIISIILLCRFDYVINWAPSILDYLYSMLTDRFMCINNRRGGKVILLPNFILTVIIRLVDGYDLWTGRTRVLKTVLKIEI